MAALTESNTRPVVIKVATLPAGVKDVDELLNTAGGDAAYERMIVEAVPAPSWMIGHLEQRHNLTTPNGAEAACEDIIDVLLRQHPVARFRYARELAQILDVPIESVDDMLQNVVLERLAYWRAHPDEKPALPTRERHRFHGLTSLDQHGETVRFDCPACESPDSAKASKPLDLWHCVACDASGRASRLLQPDDDAAPVWDRDEL